MIQNTGVANPRFQSTLPVRGATFSIPSAASLAEFQSTLPVRGATAPLVDPCQAAGISIHAPCEGSDPLPCSAAPADAISIHTPCEGSDCTSNRGPAQGCGFQSTLPVRGATANISKMLRGILDRFSNF